MKRFTFCLLLVCLCAGVGAASYDHIRTAQANELVQNIPMDMNNRFFSYLNTGTKTHLNTAKRKSDPFFCSSTWQYIWGPYLGGCQYISIINKWDCDIEEICTVTGCYQTCKWRCDDPMNVLTCNYPTGNPTDCVIGNMGQGCNPE